MSCVTGIFLSLKIFLKETNNRNRCPFSFERCNLLSARSCRRVRKRTNLSWVCHAIFRLSTLISFFLLSHRKKKGETIKKKCMITVFGFFLFFFVFISFRSSYWYTLLSFLFTTWLPCKVEGKTSAEFLILETGILYPPPKLQRNKKKKTRNNNKKKKKEKKAHFNFCSILVHARLRWMLLRLFFLFFLFCFVSNCW